MISREHDEGTVVGKKKTDARPTSYLEALMHFFKGNVGTGCFAMADAVKNGGILLAPILTLFLGIICINTQHILLKCSALMKAKYQLTDSPDYAETVELCFQSSNNQRCRQLAPAMRKTCKIFLCIMQLGFCCIYILFPASNLKQVLDFYGFKLDVHVIVILVLVPVWLSALITNLKYLAPCSGAASLCMITGLVICYYYTTKDLPHISERSLFPPDIDNLPLFFGTAMFAFEGIALVLPLQNAMGKPQNFSKTFGVLNVGMVLTTAIYVSFGFFGYWKYGEHTEGSLTLNLPTNEILAQCVKITIAFGVLLGFAIQFFVPIQIMFPPIRNSIKAADNHPFIGELIFRTIMVLVTFVVAEFVPNLSLLLSLIGAVCSTTVVLVFPPVMELIILASSDEGIGCFVFFKNMVILLLSLVGFLTGGYESLSRIIETYFV